MKGFLRKTLALCLTAVLLTTQMFTSVIAVEIPGFADLSRQVAGEGIVLLKNDNDALPLTDAETVSVFGRRQISTLYCGSGSGGEVYPSVKVSILAGLREHPGIRVNEPLAQAYEILNQQSPGTEMPSDAVLNAAAAVSEKAIVVIGRTAGEGSDFPNNGNGYLLSDAEKTMLQKVNGAFSSVIILLNVSNIVDLSWVDSYENIDSVLFVWLGGMYMGKAVADVLSGSVTPSGKMMATVAKSYADYPSAASFGASAANNYVEDIFVGYRYFETFAPDKVAYPFGFGLSYTDFDITTNGVSCADGQVLVDVTVRNTGAVKGKEVVQVYFGAPQGVLGKPLKSLAAYAKTALLKPGDAQDIAIAFDISNMASYDDSGETGHKSAYVLEAGDYQIYVGNSVRSAAPVGAYHRESLEVVQQLEEVMAPVTAFDRMVAVERDGDVVPGSEPVPLATVNLRARIDARRPQAVAQTEDRGHKLADVYNGAVTLDAFTAQLTTAQMSRLARGAGGMQSSAGNPGNAGVYGGVDAALRAYGIVPVSAHDGPSGIRQRSSDPSTLIPIGTMLACTWNEDLIELCTRNFGRELRLNNVDVLLAPGMNIQRNPLGGRNFEYFSEDPLLSGTIAAAFTRGVQSQGIGVCVKHFTANNQENNRKQTDVRVSERALREIYLKGFEIAIRTAKPYTVMSAYNKINGVFCCYNYDLMTTVLRGEWGWDGMVMTDWSLQPGTDPTNANVSGHAYRVQAQEDLFMPGDTGNSPTNAIETSISSGTGLALGELQRSTKNILNSVMKTPRFARDNGLDLYAYTPEAPYFSVDMEKSEFPRLTGILIDGQALESFNPMVLDYELYTPADALVPAVEATADAGVTVTVTPDAANGRVVIVRAANALEETEYRVFFSDRPGIPPAVDNPIYAYLDNIYINGKAIPEFYTTVFNYNYTLPADQWRPAIAVDGREDVNTEIVWNDAGKSASVIARSPHQAQEYKIYFTLTANTPPQSDEFDGDALKGFWTANNANANMAVADGSLNITTESGDLYGSADSLKNYVTQSASGDWSSVTKMSFSEKPKQHYHQFGVMLQQDKDNYVFFQLAYHSNTVKLRLTQEASGQNSVKKEVTASSNAAFAAMTDTLYFKVDKSGDAYGFGFSTDGVVFEDLGVTVTAAYADPKFALVSSNGNNVNIAAIQIRYDFVRFQVAGAGPFSDDFEGTKLQSFWTAHSADDKMSLADGALNIVTQGGDIYNTNTTLKNYVSQPAGGDWTSVTKISFAPKPSQQYHQLGVMIMQDVGNYLHFRYEVQREPSGIIRLNQETNNTSSNRENISEGAVLAAVTDTIYLKVVKSKSEYSFAFSADGVTYQALNTKITASYAAPNFVLAACNGQGKDGIAPIVVRYEEVTFEKAGQAEIPVVTIAAEGSSRIKLAEQYVLLAGGLIPEASSDVGGGYHLAYSGGGRYALYNVAVERAGYYSVTPRISSARDELVQLEFVLERNGMVLDSFMKLGGTGGWNNWIDMEPKTVYLPAGEAKLRLYYRTDGINLNWLAFNPVASYSVSVDGESDAVAIVPDRTESIAGQTVSFTVTPDDPRRDVGTVWATDGNGGSVTVLRRADGTYYFEMPEDDVTIGASLADAFLAAPSGVEFTADGCVVRMLIENETQTARRGGLYLALYDSAGRLAALDAQPFDTEARGGSQTVTCQVSGIPGGAYEARLFIWDGDHTPLMPPFDIGGHLFDL
ncbi:MAG: glycoside hydrolase family 3 C-terminal domain-containing protein [Oscillospiraceae bacterium]|jgi:beta-glucosidase-like glycosyl hydrolase|nr:glycoside hydrolase family 3 C-terminal domain-containing protein [Oscillospiraceae bacterium]